MPFCELTSVNNIPRAPIKSAGFIIWQLQTFFSSKLAGKSYPNLSLLILCENRYPLLVTNNFKKNYCITSTWVFHFPLLCLNHWSVLVLEPSLVYLFCCNLSSSSNFQARLNNGKMFPCLWLPMQNFRRDPTWDPTRDPRWDTGWDPDVGFWNGIPPGIPGGIPEKNWKSHNVEVSQSSTRDSGIPGGIP